MSGTTLEATLQRGDTTTPWGFRLQGGRDFSSPLALARVTPGSLADQCGLQAGDYLMKISGVEASSMMHKDAQAEIKGHSTLLTLAVQRGGQPKGYGSPAPGGSSYSSPSNGATPVGQKSYSTPTYSNPAVDNLTQGLKNTSISPAGQQQSARYEDKGDAQEIHYKGYQNPDHQSRSFQLLKTTVDRGQDPSAVDNPPWRSSSGMTQQPSGGGWQPQRNWTPGLPQAPKTTPSPAGGAMPWQKPTGVGGVRGRKGDAVVQQAGSGGPGNIRIPVCHDCKQPIRGPFVVALNQTWCPDHFLCANPNCRAKLVDVGFIEEGGQLYCEKDYAEMFAPDCSKCHQPVSGEIVNALDQQWHPHCFLCNHCKKPIGAGTFHIEEGKPYCDSDWKQLYQTMCHGCNFPVEPGDRFVEALGHNYHAECFNCATCQMNLEGQGFYARNNKAYCKKHAQG